MTPQEAFCPEHGPYDASLGACPYPHSGASPRPGAPTPLEDDLPTDFGPGAGGPGAAMPPEGDEGETEIPASRRSGQGFMDLGEEDETDFGHAVMEEDVTELEVVTAPVLGLLWAKEGPRRGKYYPLKHGTVVGRKEGSLIIDDPKVSGMHAKFTIEDDDFVIWDIGSANGTLVNGEKIREATVLEENDLIKIGDSVFVIKLLDPKQKRRPAPRKRTGKSSARKKRKSS